MIEASVLSFAMEYDKMNEMFKRIVTKIAPHRTERLSKKNQN